MTKPGDAVFALKAGFRELVKLVGGQDYAARLLGVSQSRISENAAPHQPDCTARIHHIAALEAEAGVPVVTRILAELAGHELVPLGTFKTEDPHIHLARIIKDAGEVSIAISQALADGRISPAEARTLKREAGGAIEAMHGFVAQMNSIIEEGGSRNG